MILLALLLAQADKFTVTLNDGSKVRLVAVTDSGFEQSWRPDGTSVQISRGDLGDYPFKIHKGWYVFFKIVSPKHKGDKYYYPYLNTGTGDHWADRDEDHRDTWFCVQRFVPPNAATADIKIGISTVARKSVASARYRNGRRTHGTCFATKIMWTSAIYKDSRSHSKKPQCWVDFTVPPKYQAWDLDFQALGTDGNTPDGGGTTWIDGQTGGETHIEANPDQIAQIHLMARPISHFVIPNVVIQPKERRIS
jgi:hypothetical protein